MHASQDAFSDDEVRAGVAAPALAAAVAEHMRSASAARRAAEELADQVAPLRTSLLPAAPPAAPPAAALRLLARHLVLLPRAPAAAGSPMADAWGAALNAAVAFRCTEDDGPFDPRAVAATRVALVTVAAWLAPLGDAHQPNSCHEHDDAYARHTLHLAAAAGARAGAELLRAAGVADVLCCEECSNTVFGIALSYGHAEIADSFPPIETEDGIGGETALIAAIRAHSLKHVLQLARVNPGNTLNWGSDTPASLAVSHNFPAACRAFRLRLRADAVADLAVEALQLGHLDCLRALSDEAAALAPPGTPWSDDLADTVWQAVVDARQTA